MFGIDLDDFVSETTKSLGFKGIENVSDSKSFGTWLSGAENNLKKTVEAVPTATKATAITPNKTPFDFSLNNPIVLASSGVLAFVILGGK